jgi:hypothetical protein
MVVRDIDSSFKQCEPFGLPSLRHRPSLYPSSSPPIMSASPLPPPTPPTEQVPPPPVANPDPPTDAPIKTEDTLMPDATAVDPTAAPGGPTAEELSEAATAQAEADAKKAADEEWLRAEKERKERESWSETLYIQVNFPSHVWWRTDAITMSKEVCRTSDANASSCNVLPVLLPPLRT